MNIPILDLLPAPFVWIDIPGKGYSIGKYPITNAQFAKFIEAGGYSEPKWWMDKGWHKCEAGNWTQPPFWNDPIWNGLEQPVNGVSWYEAAAFCSWLSAATGENIMLPTEDQWQYAAQSDDGRAYPWGNDWDGSRCNNSVDQIGAGKTTPVRQFEGKGDSPFGVVDMVGNVWEWCLTGYDNNGNATNSNARYYALRGISWGGIYKETFRCTYRVMDSPYFRYETRGFRISRS